MGRPAGGDQSVIAVDLFAGAGGFSTGAVAAGCNEGGKTPNV